MFNNKLMTVQCHLGSRTVTIALFSLPPLPVVVDFKEVEMFKQRCGEYVELFFDVSALV